ncbi:MAG: Gfo/Idh/MocA family oxidoreductase [Planctomycetes bacterium]|nr:Gfo/Idh/MocA family oxidoreductase [Planctomycetota bacterium]
MSEKIRLALVGCGGMAGAHLEAYGEIKRKGLDFFDIVGVCDPAEDRAREFARRIAGFQASPAATVYSSLEEMLSKERLHAVDTGSPHHLHHVIACTCLEAGLDVLVEKPLGVTVRAGWKMVRTAERTGRILATAEQVRRWIGPRTVAWAIRHGELSGRPRFFLAHSCHGPKEPQVEVEVKSPTWRQDKLQGGGGMIIDGGVHYADFLITCYGEPDTLFATCGNFNRSYVTRPDGSRLLLDCPDTAIGHLRFKNGVAGTWVWTGASPGRPTSFTVHYGDEGSVYAEGGYPMMPEFHRRDRSVLPAEDLRRQYLASLSEDERARLFPPQLFPDPQSLRGDHGVELEVHDFLCCVRDRRRPEVDGLDGLKAQAVSEAYLESSYLNRSVSVEEVLSGKVRAYQEEIDGRWGL